jgi:hypothetical protein
VGEGADIDEGPPGVDPWPVSMGFGVEAEGIGCGVDPAIGRLPGRFASGDGPPSEGLEPFILWIVKPLMTGVPLLVAVVFNPCCCSALGGGGGNIDLSERPLPPTIEASIPVGGIVEAGVIVLIV